MKCVNNYVNTMLRWWKIFHIKNQFTLNIVWDNIIMFGYLCDSDIIVYVEKWKEENLE